MPLDFTEQQRRQLSTRLMAQAPRDLSPAQVAAVRKDLDRRVKGLPPDVFMALDALRLLAEQGNTVARDLFMDESDRLGLTQRSYSFRK